MSELTFGQKYVGLTFNPSGLDAVGEIKQLYADVIDKLDALRKQSDSGEVKRLCSVAITEAQGAQMWAVKLSPGKTNRLNEKPQFLMVPGLFCNITVLIQVNLA